MSEELHATLSRRNAAGVLDMLRRYETQLMDQQKRIDQLNDGMSSLIARIAALEHGMAVARVLSIGSGPTVVVST